MNDSLIGEYLRNFKLETSKHIFNIYEYDDRSFMIEIDDAHRKVDACELSYISDIFGTELFYDENTSRFLIPVCVKNKDELAEKLYMKYGKL